MASDSGMEEITVAEPGSSVRKRKSRAISSLTSQQIKDKRETDRRAQRALRQRTKDRIKDLEETIDQLKEDHSLSENRNHQRIQSLLEENRRLRDQLERTAGRRSSSTTVSILPTQDGMAGPETGPRMDKSQAINLPRSDWIPRSTASPAGTAHLNDSPSGRSPHWTHDQDGNLEDNDHGHPSRGDVETNSVESWTQPSPRHSHLLRLTTVDWTKTDEIGNLSERTATKETYINTGQACPDPDTQFRGGDPTASMPETSTPSTPVSHSAHGTDESTCIFARLPRHLPPLEPLDQILVHFLASHKSMATLGYPIHTLIGPPQVPLRAILKPETSGDLHPLGRVMSEVLSTFPHVKVPEKVSFMYLMHRTMRWQISPTMENFLLLPRWLRPTATQITVPHSAWIDNIPWPGVRDMLIENPDKYPFPLFSEAYSHCVTVNWPYDEVDVASEHGHEVVPNKIFEKHIHRLANWTVSRKFHEQFPEMMAAIYSRD